MVCPPPHFISFLLALPTPIELQLHLLSPRFGKLSISSLLLNSYTSFRSGETSPPPGSPHKVRNPCDIPLQHDVCVALPKTCDYSLALVICIICIIIKWMNVSPTELCVPSMSHRWLLCSTPTDTQQILSPYVLSEQVLHHASGSFFLMAHTPTSVCLR